MAWSKPVVNVIKPDIKNLSIYLRSTKKFGKTTLFRDMILAKYGDPSRGLLVGCGNEIGYKMLDNLNVTQVKTYKDMTELANWLITEKGKEHNIEIVAFDTGDELALITDAETIRQSNVENPTKKCKSIKGAFGGYTAGEKFSANDLIKPYMTRLQDAGFGVWVIAHTKFKTIKEKGGLDEDGYMQLSSNMGADYEAAFGDIFDVTLTGVIDRDLETKQVGDKTKKYATDEIRKLYFRGTTLIDAGGRFADGAVPEFMVFDKPDMGAEFVRVVEEGMEKSKSTLGKRENNPVVSTPKPEIQVTPEPENSKVDFLSDIEDDDLLDETPVSEDPTESKYPTDLNGTIRTMYKECKDATLKTSVKEVIAEYGKLNDVDEDGLKRIYDMMTE
jgi:hypothetical protein